MAFTVSERLREVTAFDETKSGVKGLTDAGITSIPRIFTHPPETISSLKSSVSLSIPTIDLSGLNSPERRVTIVDEIKSAASKWGFFQVVNHGVPAASRHGIINAIKAFHEQPQEAKLEYYKRDKSLGFTYASNYDLYKSKAASWSDLIQAWMSPNAPAAANVPEVCRRELFEWDAHMTRVGEELTELLGEGLGLRPRRLQELTCVDGRAFAGLYYPYCPQADLTMGVSSHTDPGTITVLLQNQLPGLQVKHGDDWVNVQPVPGALIVNVGNLLQMMSNDEYKSVQHRVRANTSPEPRISAATFFYLGKWKEAEEMGPLPELVLPEKPQAYRTFTFAGFNETFYNKNGKTVIDTFKIKKNDDK